MDAFAVVWALIATAVISLEIAGRLGVLALAPLGPTLALLRGRPRGRAALVIAWMWLGWHLFAR